MYQFIARHPKLKAYVAVFSLILLSVFSDKLWADELIRIKVTSEFIDLHTGPGRGYPAFHALERNEPVTLIKSKNIWIKAVTDDGIEGWINRKDIVNTVGVNGEEVRLGIASIEDYSNRSWEIGFGAGQFDEVPSLGIHGGYRFTRNLMVELQLTQATGNQSKNELIMLGLVHQPFPEWRLSPYFSLATGNITTTARSEGSQLDDDSDEIFMLGTGAYYYLSNRFMLRLQINQYTSLPSENFNTEINELKLGFSTFF